MGSHASKIIYHVQTSGLQRAVLMDWRDVDCWTLSVDNNGSVEAQFCFGPYIARKISGQILTPFHCHYTHPLWMDSCMHSFQNPNIPWTGIKQTNKQTQCNPFKQPYLKYFHAQQVRLNQYYNFPTQITYTLPFEYISHLIRALLKKDKKFKM